MKSPYDVCAQIAGIYTRRHRDWLRDEITPVQEDAERWPLKIPLSIPSEQEALRNIDAVRGWVDAWRQWCGAGEVKWSTRHWPRLGHHEVPEQVVFSRPSDAATIAGKSEQWERARARAKKLVSFWPVLIGHLTRHFQWLAECADVEFQRLIESSRNQPLDQDHP